MTEYIGPYGATTTTTGTSATITYTNLGGVTVASYAKPNVAQQILALIEAAGAEGLTDREIAAALGGTSRAQVQKYAKRRLDLLHLGLIRKAKARRHDLDTGRDVKVWVTA